MHIKNSELIAEGEVGGVEGSRCFSKNVQRSSSVKASTTEQSTGNHETQQTLP